MATAAPPNYRTAPGADRCDRCFHRNDSGQSCKKWPDYADYVPNGICDVFAERSYAQRFADEQKGELTVTKPGDETQVDEFGQTLKDVEIFRSGTWNGKAYSNKDLDDIVKAADQVGYKAPVTLGHTDDPAAPAYGYAVNLRRQGDTLLADFEDVPDDLVSQIKDKRYDTVSSEIFFDLKRGNKSFRRALRCVAVLGAHPPGVSDLKPLSEALGVLADQTPSVIVDYRPGAVDMTTKNTQQDQNPGNAGDQGTGRNAAPPADQHNAQEAATEIARLQEQLRRATAEKNATDAALEAARTEAEAARALAAAGSTSQLTIQRLQEEARAATNALKQIHEERRQNRIAALVKSVDRPALRGHIEALAELGTRGDVPGGQAQVVKFKAAGADEASDTSAVGVLEDLVRLLNKDTAHLFEEAVVSGDMSRKHAATYMDDAGNQLMELTGDYKRAHPTVTIDEAREAVMGDPKNRDLVRRYNQVLNGLN